MCAPGPSGQYDGLADAGGQRAEQGIGQYPAAVISEMRVKPLAAADQVIIPIQCEYFALEGLSQLVKTIDMIRKGINPD